MKIISGDRGSGKTTMIATEIFTVKNAVVVVMDGHRKSWLEQFFRDKECDAKVITFKEFNDRHIGIGRHKGYSSFCNYFMEDFNDWVCYLMPGCNIKTITLTPDIHLQQIPKDIDNRFQYISDLQTSRRALINKNELMDKQLDDLYQQAEKWFKRYKNLSDNIVRFLNTPWYKKIFFKFEDVGEFRQE